MKVQIRPRGITLTKRQCDRFERDLDLVLARFGERIDRVVVEKVEHSDTDVSLAIEHAGKRVARSVCRAIETEVLVRG